MKWIALAFLLAASSAGAATEDARPAIVAQAAIDDDTWVTYGRIYVDGLLAGELTKDDAGWTCTPVHVEPGRHTLRIELDDGRVQQRTVDVKQGDSRDVVRVHFPRLTREALAPPAPPPAHGRSNWLFVVPLVWGVAASAFGTGSVIAGADKHAIADAMQRAANLQAPGSCTSPDVSSTSSICAHSARAGSRAANEQIGGAIAIGVGTGVVAASIVALVLTGKARPARTAWNVTPLVSPWVAGVGVVARF